MKLSKQIGKTMLSALLLVPLAKAQESREIPETHLTLDGALSESGFATQNTILYKDAKQKATTMIETLTNSDANLGLDYKRGWFQLNAAFGVRQEEDVGRISLVANKSKDTYLGATLISQPEEDQGILIGGIGLEDKIRLEGAIDSFGNVRGRSLWYLDDSFFSIGGGRNKEGDLDVNLSYNTESIWASVRLGENKPLDARIVIGKIPLRKSDFFASTRDTGINMPDNYIDQTFKFTIGTNPVFSTNLGAPYSLLGTQPGDYNLDVRYIEDTLISGSASLRVGDLGPFKRTSITAGVYTELPTATIGGFGVLGTDIGKNISLYLKGELREDHHNSLGIFYELRF